MVADESVVPELVAAGRDPATVLPLGIPVRSSFLQTHDRARTLAGIGLSDRLPTVTLMGGSLALGGIKTILEELDSIPRVFNIVVVAAQNDKLYADALAIALHSAKPIAVLRFCHFMDALLQATDLLVTKPGGLTVTEALSSGTPLAVFQAIGAQEEQNRQFLLNHDLAIDLGSGADCARVIEALLAQPGQLEEMARRARRMAKTDAGEKIYRQLRAMVDQGSPIPAHDYLAGAEESLNDKFRDLIDELKARLESNRLTGRLLDLIRGHEAETADLPYYELSDEEVSRFLESTADERESSPDDPA